ncbi:hypothetical protein SARC_01883 [Sphaeroforma arctica JP610]|uniref:Uncharacterized protein n=1 Tax=Sphaeroforma arctica JP610 TaxID=667725 RepID=A0A0L0GAL5_9EUKA|nr:hypothetical protein SARC_01883 [Sphaeroforma arctica JP610]KNC85936.1 hypothetical protein SARC_01883 [Sphaeroforma arctica JP610]|eukprot:XP_014159838.1 hypothetical protein SARC_01883 [Sphaeroforma arctica JP610]
MACRIVDRVNDSTAAFVPDTTKSVISRAKEDRHSLNLLYNQLKLQIEKKEADDASQAQERRNMNSNFTEQMEELKIAHEAVKAEKEWLRSVVDMCNEKVDLLEAELENEQALGHEAVQLLEKAKAEKRTLMKEVEQLQLKLTDATRERKAAEIKVEMLESKGSSANAKKSNLSTTDGHNPDSNEKTPQLGQKRKARKTRMEKISADEDTEMRIGSPPSPTPIRLMAQYNETSSDELKSKMLNDLKAMARERDDAKEMLQNTMNELEQQKVAIDHLNKELKVVDYLYH